MPSLRHMPSRSSLFALLAFSLLLATGCRPQIGDSCTLDSECDRGQVCDTASPGGYCIEYDCEPNSCPDEAVCVDFYAEGVLLESACMERCKNDGDCRQRDGYRCRRDAGPVGFCGIPLADQTDANDEQTPQPSDGSAAGSGAALEGSGGGA